jgi:hypothetical protein
VNHLWAARNVGVMAALLKHFPVLLYERSVRRSVSLDIHESPTVLHEAVEGYRTEIVRYLTDRLPSLALENGERRQFGRSGRQTVPGRTPRQCIEVVHWSDMWGGSSGAEIQAAKEMKKILRRAEASLFFPWHPNFLLLRRGAEEKDEEDWDAEDEDEDEEKEEDLYEYTRHSLFSNYLKMTIAAYRVGTWYLARMTGTVDTSQAKRSLPWLMVSYAMPHIGLGWMAPGWLPPSPPFAVDVEDMARIPTAMMVSEPRPR